VPAQNENLHIVGFVALTALISSVFYTLIVGAGHVGAGAGLYVTGLMWSPALAAFSMVYFRHLDVRCLGLASFGGRYAAIGYLAPITYAAIAYGLVWLFGFGFFPDPGGIASLSQHLGWHVTNPVGFITLYFPLMATTQMITSLAHALGEEIGWRGFLGPRLIGRLGFAWGSIVLGVVWAAWHLPLLLFADYNSGTPWWFSLPCFCALTIGLSFIMMWLRLVSNSVWPCAILHASHNLFIQGFFTPLTGARGRFTSYAVGEFGIAVPSMILLFAFLVWLKRRRVSGVGHALIHTTTR
jgi:membrane protease YdiL (CAAX protease family)